MVVLCWHAAHPFLVLSAGITRAKVSYAGCLPTAIASFSRNARTNRKQDGMSPDRGCLGIRRACTLSLAESLSECVGATSDRSNGFSLERCQIAVLHALVS